MFTNTDSAAASAFIKCSSLPELGGRDFPRKLTFDRLPARAYDEGLTSC
jgi:hypothetical protein